jgi:hypothetical protein
MIYLPFLSARAAKLRIRNGSAGVAFQLGRERLQNRMNWASLGRILRDTRRCNKAHAMLADTFNGFIEGFDTTGPERR